MLGTSVLREAEGPRGDVKTLVNPTVVQTLICEFIYFNPTAGYCVCSWLYLCLSYWAWLVRVGRCGPVDVMFFCFYSLPLFFFQIHNSLCTAKSLLTLLFGMGRVLTALCSLHQHEGAESCSSLTHERCTLAPSSDPTGQNTIPPTNMTNCKLQASEVVDENFTKCHSCTPKSQSLKY